MPAPALHDYFARQTLSYLGGFRTTIQDCPFHHHPECELVFHRIGSGRNRIRSGGQIREIAYEEESAVLHPAGTAHDQTTEAPIEDACILFRAPQPLPAALRRTTVFAPSVVWSLRAELLFLAEPRPHAEPLERREMDLRVTAVLVRLLASSGAGDRPSHGRIAAEKARQFLRERFANLGRMEEAAEAAGVSYHYLRHVFRDAFGMSLMQWLDRLRVERAQELLRRSPLPLKVIARLCGYANERYFSERFRRAAGVTPGAYRAGR